MNNELRLGGVTLRNRSGNIRLINPHTDREIFEIEAADVDAFITFMLETKRRQTLARVLSKDRHPAGSRARYN